MSNQICDAKVNLVISHEDVKHVIVFACDSKKWSTKLGSLQQILSISYIINLLKLIWKWHRKMCFSTSEKIIPRGSIFMTYVILKIKVSISLPEKSLNSAGMTLLCSMHEGSYSILYQCEIMAC